MKKIYFLAAAMFAVIAIMAIVSVTTVSADFEPMKLGCYEDMDCDMLTDYAEVAIYGTDPADWDTDDGGVSDGMEVIVYDTDPLDPGDEMN